MPFVLRPQGEHVVERPRAPLADRLATLGGWRRRVKTASSLLEGLVLLATTLLVVTLADFWFDLPAIARMGLLVGVVELIRRRARVTLRYAQSPASAQATALAIEKLFPILNDALASAVDFTSGEGARRRSGESDRLRSVTIRRAENLLARCQLRGFVPVRRLLKRIALALVMMSLVGGVVVSSPKASLHALLRIVDPYGNHPKPTRTMLEIVSPEKFPALTLKGEPFAIRFHLSGVVPELAKLEIRRGADLLVETIPLTGEEESTQLDREYRLPANFVDRPFAFRLRAGDGLTEWCAVEVRQAPLLVPLDGRPSPQMRLTYPEYTGLLPREAPDGTGVIEAVSGTTIRFRAATDRPIVSAELRHTGESPALVTLPVSVLVPHPLTAPVLPLLAERLLAPIPVAVQGVGRDQLELEFTPVLSGLYTLRFVDDFGLPGTRLFEFRIHADPVPEVTLQLHGMPEPITVLPDAKLDLRLHAEDRIFGLHQLLLEYRRGKSYQTFPMKQESDSSVAALLGTPAARHHAYASGVRERREVVPIAKFVDAQGRAPGDGDLLYLRAMATDHDDRTAAKPPGYSREVEIRILNRSGFDSKIEQELAALGPELKKLADEQADARRRAEAAKEGEAIDDRAQQRIRAKLQDPEKGPRAAVERLRTVTRGAGLPASEATNALESVAAELAQVDEQELEAAEASLHEAKSNPDKRLTALEMAKKHQEKAENRLTTLAEQIVRRGAVGKLRSELRTVREKLRASEEENRPESKANQLEELAERVGKLLDETGRQADRSMNDAAESRRQAESKRTEAAEARNRGDGARARKLLSEAEQLEERAQSGEEEGLLLRKAMKSLDGAPRDELRAAAEQLRKNRPGESVQSRKNAAAALDRLARGLEGTASRSGTTSEEADQIANDQDELRKRIAQVDKEEDRLQKLQREAQHQEELERKTEKLARKLQREGKTEAAESLRDAARSMEEAREQLEKGKAPLEKVENAAESLEKAANQVDKSQTETEEQLAREKRDDFLNRVKTLVERQKGMVAEASRLQNEATASRRWSRPLIAGLRDLAESQRTLTAELRELKPEAEAPVFGKLLELAGEAMDRSVRMAEERKDDLLADTEWNPETQELGDKRLRAPMEAAIRNLTIILDSLKEETQKGKPAPPQPSETPEAEGPKKEIAGGTPPQAQLKALRALQADTLARTEQFAREHPDPEKWTDDDRDELRTIEKLQKEVAELVDKVAETLRKARGGI